MEASAALEVRDHGAGLPADVGDHLFERFWRTEGGRTRGRGGAGLGLAIVKAIVETHRGEVHAYNAPDGGAVFRVTSPWRRSAPGAPDRGRLSESVVASPAEGPAEQDGGRARCPRRSLSNSRRGGVVSGRWAKVFA